MKKIDEVVAQLRPARFTTSQAAALIGRSSDTVKRWRKNGLVTPSDSMTFGSLTVSLYTPEDILKLRITARGMRPGPQPKTHSD